MKKTNRKAPYSPYIPGHKLIRVLPRGARRYVCVSEPNHLKTKVGQEITVNL